MLTRRAAERLQALVLVLTAVFFAWQLVSGVLFEQLGAHFGWLALVSIALLILMAGSYRLAADGVGAPTEGAQVPAWPVLLLALPLLASLLVPLHTHGEHGTSAALLLDGTLGTGAPASGVLYLAPADAEVQSLWLAPLDGGEPREVFAPERGVLGYAPSPDGAHVAVTVPAGDGGEDIWLVDVLGRVSQPVTTCAPGACRSPAWSADGELLAYERVEPGEETSRIWLLDLLTGETLPLYEDAQVAGREPQFSRQGSRLAFYDGNASAIRVVDLESGGAELVASQVGDVGALSPDGSAVVYPDIRAVGRQYFSQLWLATLGAEGDLRSLVDAPQEEHAPAWSPDGRWIAYGSRRLDRSEGMAIQLMLYDMEAGEVQQVTSSAEYNQTVFDWNHEGSRLLVQRFRLDAPDALPELWIYDVATGELTLLVENAFDGTWLPS